MALHFFKILLLKLLLWKGSLNDELHSIKKLSLGPTI